MSANFQKIKEYLMDLEYTITYEDADEEVFVIQNEEDGIRDMVLACADPILIIEQFLIEIPQPSLQIYQSLLQKNRDIVHGALALSDEGKKVVFRDTLRLENLDLNELEGSVNALALLLSEYSDDLIGFTKN